MSDETTLLPCPICGKKVSIARTENEVGERWWFITRGTYKTTRCNCRLFLESEKFTCGWNDDYSLECRAKLIDKWNTRATLGALRTTSDQEETVRSFLRKICPNRDWCYLGEHEHALIADLISDIAATLGSDDDYEAKMDALLCRLTTGKWSKSRAYDLDFMEQCINEEFEMLYAKELADAELENGTLTAEQVRETVEKHWHDLSAEYDMPEATALPEYSYDWQAIADELSARAERTCHAESDLSEWVCSACQCWIPLGLTPENIKHASEWRYCPHCGARVKAVSK